MAERLNALDSKSSLGQLNGGSNPPLSVQVEIKEFGCEAEVLEALQPLNLSTFVITSFRLEVIDRVEQISPQITIGF